MFLMDKIRYNTFVERHLPSDALQKLYNGLYAL